DRPAHRVAERPSGAPGVPGDRRVRRARERLSARAGGRDRAGGGLPGGAGDHLAAGRVPGGVAVQRGRRAAGVLGGPALRGVVLLRPRGAHAPAAAADGAAGRALRPPRRKGDLLQPLSPRLSRRGAHLRRHQRDGVDPDGGAHRAGVGALVRPHRVPGRHRRPQLGADPRHRGVVRPLAGGRRGRPLPADGLVVVAEPRKGIL
ncbi:MAG: hypothetical protein AVDCRST_MAG68-1985, partial [uncultured Gemmatimonadetes bacterium]